MQFIHRDMSYPACSKYTTTITSCFYNLILEGKLAAARYRCKFVEVSAVLNYKIDELLVGVVTQIRLKRKLKFASSFDCDAAAAGCYRQARGVVELLFGRNQRRRRLFRSCDNLLSLWSVVTKLRVSLFTSAPHNMWDWHVFSWLVMVQQTNSANVWSCA